MDTPAAVLVAISGIARPPPALRLIAEVASMRGRLSRVDSIFDPDWQLTLHVSTLLRAP